MANASLVIIGSGLAGQLLVQALRKQSFLAPIDLICTDSGDFYHKPQLSCALTNQRSVEALVQTQCAELVTRYDVNYHPYTSVTRLNIEKKCVETATKTYPYQQCVLACGALPRLFECAGSGVARVLTVNHLSEYQRVRQQLTQAKQVLIIGAGLVGIELTYDLAQAGYQVHLVHDAAYPLQTLLPEPIAQSLLTSLQSMGVCWYGESVIERLDEEGAQLRCQLNKDRSFVVDCAISAIGLQPNTQLAKDAHLSVNKGIVVDRYLQTSAPQVYALGDCAEVMGKVLYYILPIRHAVTALTQTLLGSPTQVVYPPMPIAVKMPCHPTVICPPQLGQAGHWHISGENKDWYATFEQDGQIFGFVLCGKYLKERPKLLPQIPHWIGE